MIAINDKRFRNYKSRPQKKTMQPKNSKRTGISLPLLLALMLVACGGKDAVAPENVEKEAYEDLRAAIVEVVEDPDRQKEILGLVEDYQRDFKKLREAVQMRRMELRHLNADYDATREQFHEFIEKYDAEVITARKTVSESRRAFVESTTPEEWDSLMKVDSKAIKKMVGVIRGI